MVDISVLVVPFLASQSVRPEVPDTCDTEDACQEVNRQLNENNIILDGESYTNGQGRFQEFSKVGEGEGCVH